jgi:hypothetical protein
MSEKSIRKDIVRQVLKILGPTFRTKELSTHQVMLEAHANLSSNSQYHAWVGKFLSQYCDDVRNLSKSQHARGAQWENLLHQGSISSASAMQPQAAPPDATGAPPEVGPQYGPDNAFTARMRLHQSWYRAVRLGVPCGTGPHARSPNAYGNMLRREDGARGMNFLSPEIHQIALARLRQGGGVVEPFRLLHNMLSSQPMCFNLFGWLVQHRELATRLLRTIPELQVDEVLDVKLEFAPAPAHLYLADATAFDAFVEYRHTDGTRALLGVETKLTESFTKHHYASPNYDRWMNGADSPWLADSAVAASDIRHNQLWRDHLLAISMRDRSGSTYRHATLMFVRHPLDLECEHNVTEYRRLLTPGDRTFMDMSLDRLLTLWRPAAISDGEREWLDAFADRYLNIELSDEARP